MNTTKYLFHINVCFLLSILLTENVSAGGINPPPRCKAPEGYQQSGYFELERMIQTNSKSIMELHANFYSAHIQIEDAVIRESERWLRYENENNQSVNDMRTQSETSEDTLGVIENNRRRRNRPSFEANLHNVEQAIKHMEDVLDAIEIAIHTAKNLEKEDPNWMREYYPEQIQQLLELKETSLAIIMKLETSDFSESTRSGNLDHSISFNKKNSQFRVLSIRYINQLQNLMNSYVNTVEQINAGECPP